MTLMPRERVERALRGDPVDKTPFTVYEYKLPRSTVERQLRNQGLCVAHRMGVVTTHRPDVKVVQTNVRENGKQLVRTDYETPHGTLTSITEPQEFTTWTHKHLFSGPEDYEKLAFMVDNEQYEPNYDAFARAQERAGDDEFFMSNFGLEPLQQIISGGVMGTAAFGIEWMERRDEVLALYEANVRAARRRYALVADSPCTTFNYGGNVTVEVIGPAVFDEYYLPHYLEAAEIVHARGKRIGCHLDANNRLIAESVRNSGLDYIEAFTPAPDTDMSLEDAVAAWPDQCIWINFPSSVHLASTERIAEMTRSLLEAARDHPRFLIGVTEDVPEDRWEESFLTIMRTIEEF